MFFRSDPFRIDCVIVSIFCLCFVLFVCVFIRVAAVVHVVCVLLCVFVIAFPKQEKTTHFLMSLEVDPPTTHNIKLILELSRLLGSINNFAKDRLIINT